MLSDIQTKPPAHCPGLPAGKGQGRGQFGFEFGPGLGSSRPLPRVSPVRMSPPPALPHYCSAVWGGTSQICRNNGLGRGQVPLRAQQRAGAAATDCKTASTPPMVAALFPDSVSPALRSPQSFSWVNFPCVPGILISSSPGGLPCRSPEASRLRSPPAAATAIAPQVRDARRLRAPNFPHLGPTILVRPSPPLAKP